MLTLIVEACAAGATLEAGTSREEQNPLPRLRLPTPAELLLKPDNLLAFPRCSALGGPVTRLPA
jgi:hypothetical protein